MLQAKRTTLPPGFEYIFYSTVLAVFTDRVLILVGGVNFYLFYLVVICNLAYLALSGWLWMSRKLLFFLAYITASGLFGLARGTGSAPGFIKAYVGIVLCALYYPAFMRFIRFDVTRCMALYAKVAFYLAIFGILYFPFQGLGRLASVFSEPISFALVCTPAVFYYLDQWQRTRQYGLRLVTLVFAMVLTLSSAGFLGLLFVTAMFTLRRKSIRFAVPLIVFALGLIMYSSSQYFRLRLDDSVKSVLTSDLTGVNNSTFGLIANLFVTEQAFVDHPILGGGLGSHIVSHGKYLGNVNGVGPTDVEGITSLGEWDASSLLLRIISELGLVGICYAGWFLWYFFPRGGTPAEQAIAICIWCYIFVKFLRSGVYFNPEEFFFFSVYTVNGMLVRSRREVAAPAPLRMLTPQEAA